MVKKLIAGIIMCVVFFSCRSEYSGNTPAENGIYYWRTTFTLSDAEKEFLRKHDVRKMYVRFFDVDCSDGGVEPVVPEATVKFPDSVPEGLEIIPTVYITKEAMQTMELDEEEYAGKILKRIKAICAQNKISFKEIQLDCDWTKGTRKPFYNLCEAMKRSMDSTQILSSTIRLHQLTQDPPPVDKGVLMVYNTGNLMEMTTENSIFSEKDIAPYLSDDRLSTYPLPLDVAYPTYGWSLVFYPSDERYCFDRIMRRTEFRSYPQLVNIGPNLYEATAMVDFSDGQNYWDRLYRGYRVKTERPTAGEILKIKRKIDSRLKGKSHNNILYHLDDTQLKHYTDNEISKIYSRN